MMVSMPDFEFKQSLAASAFKIASQAVSLWQLSETTWLQRACLHVAAQQLTATRSYDSADSGLPRLLPSAGSYGPILVRLAWHSSGTYKKEDNTGGSNGATMRFRPEAEHSANAGLHVARELLEPVKKQVCFCWALCEWDAGLPLDGSFMLGQPCSWECSGQRLGCARMDPL